MSSKYRFSIDRGGTFTDVFAQCPSGKTRVCKLLSKHECYADAPTEGIRRIIELVCFEICWSTYFGKLAGIKIAMYIIFVM